jgi:hypothetical protein
MVFREDSSLKKFAEYLGYLFMYFTFTTILYFVLRLTNKFPKDWTYWHVIFITATLILISKLIRKGLE